MHGDLVNKIRESVETAVIEVAWAQWSALTAAVAPVQGRSAWTVVDPEALVLASLSVAPLERRLEDVVAAWAGTAGFLMSKARFRGLRELFPDRGEGQVEAFARYALRGGDSRWKSWVSSTSGDAYTPRDKSLGRIKLTEGSALILRLRAGFGVNAKADVLGTLLGLHGEAADLREITTMTGYSERMIRTATEEMALAGFILEIEGRPSSFYADPDSWEDVLRAGSPVPRERRSAIAPWRFWAAFFAFFCDVSDWGRKARDQHWTEYVAGSRSRDLVERHAPRLQKAGIRPLGPGMTEVTHHLETFHDVVERVRSWALDNL